MQEILKTWSGSYSQFLRGPGDEASTYILPAVVFLCIEGKRVLQLQTLTCSKNLLFFFVIMFIAVVEYGWNT